MSKQENRNGLTLLFRVHARCMNLSVDINTSTLCYKVTQEQDMTGACGDGGQWQNREEKHVVW